MPEPLALGVDYAAPHSREQVRCLKEKGVSFIVRYLTLPQHAWKRLTRAEAEMISEEGLNLVSVYQARMNRPEDFTRTLAKRDAEAALENAEQVGQPTGTTIYFAVDFDAGPQHLQALLEYFGAVKDILAGRYQVGVYGSYWTCDNLAALVPYRWQTYAWSKGKIGSYIHLYQFHNGANWCSGQNDLNLCYRLPGWWRHGGMVTPQKPPRPWPFWRVLRKGDRGPDVAEVQRLLYEAGHDPRGIDGVFGPNTEAAVRSFQQARGLTVDGIVGPEVADALKPEPEVDWKARALAAEAKLAKIEAILREK